MLFAARTLAIFGLILTLLIIGAAEYFMLQEMRGLPLDPFLEWLVVRPVTALAAAILGVVGAGIADRKDGLGRGFMLLSGLILITAGGWSGAVPAAFMLIGMLVTFSVPRHSAPSP